jgi:hypothetical protein
MMPHYLIYMSRLPQITNLSCFYTFYRHIYELRFSQIIAEDRHPEN